MYSQKLMSKLILRVRKIKKKSICGHSLSVTIAKNTMRPTYGKRKRK